MAYENAHVMDMLTLNSSPYDDIAFNMLVRSTNRRRRNSNYIIDEMAAL